MRKLKWFLVGVAAFLAVSYLAYGQELKNFKIGIANATPYVIIVRVQQFYPDDKEFPWHEVFGAEIQPGESFVTQSKRSPGIYGVILSIPAIDYSGTEVLKLGAPAEGMVATIVIRTPEGYEKPVNESKMREV